MVPYALDLLKLVHFTNKQESRKYQLQGGLLIYKLELASNVIWFNWQILCVGRNCSLWSILKICAYTVSECIGSGESTAHKAASRFISKETQAKNI